MNILQIIDYIREITKELGIFNLDKKRHNQEYNQEYNQECASTGSYWPGRADDKHLFSALHSVTSHWLLEASHGESTSATETSKY